MKKIFLFFNLTVFYLLLTINFSYSSVTNKIIANVGDQIISSYELKNKIRTILFLSNQEINQKNINLVKSNSLNSLINYKLKKNELALTGYEKNLNERIKGYIKSFASKYNTDENGIKELFKINDINYDLYIEEIEAEMLWKDLIFNMFNNRIDLNENEITIELNKIIQNQENVKEYELAEIEILFTNTAEDKKNINKVYSQIKELGFGTVASTSSISSSAVSAGKLGWINSKSLSQDVLSAIKNMKKGQISDPIFKAESIIFLKLLNKKELKLDDTNIQQIREKLIAQRKVEFFNLYSNNYLSKIKNNTLVNFR